MTMTLSHLWDDQPKTFHEGHGVVGEGGSPAVQTVCAAVQAQFGVHL